MQEFIAYLENHSGLFAALAGIVGVLASILTFLIRLMRRNSGLGRMVKELQADLNKCHGELATLTLKESQATAARDQLKKENEKLAEVVSTSETKVAELNGRIEKGKEMASSELADFQTRLDAERRRIVRALGKDGQIWTERVLHNAPDFRPLQPGSRRTPIISLLNLKGGVGKTTIAANLGAALDSLGYRVLLLDLDLQGSLTGLFLPEAAQAPLFDEEKMIGDYLAASFDAEYPDLRDYVQPILASRRSGLVPTTDHLAYAEMNLTIRWLLREGNRDPRFLLRREMHVLRRITNEYDIVLLDCPPVMNVSCVNALAASDYVLIPIQPSKQATARVPILLQRLKTFRENVNSELNVLGIVANRTHRSELTVEEENRLSALRGQCKDIWGLEVPLFDTFIRQNVEVRAAEDEHRTLVKSDQMFATFVDLASEVEARLPTFCKASASSGELVAEEAMS